jgi:hypothetical protein
MSPEKQGQRDAEQGKPKADVSKMHPNDRDKYLSSYDHTKKK